MNIDHLAYRTSRVELASDLSEVEPMRTSKVLLELRELMHIQDSLAVLVDVSIKDVDELLIHFIFFLKDPASGFTRWHVGGEHKSMVPWAVAKVLLIATVCRKHLIDDL